MILFLLLTVKFLTVRQIQSLKKLKVFYASLFYFGWNLLTKNERNGELFQSMSLS